MRRRKARARRLQRFSVTLAGTLDVSFLEGFQLIEGMSFTIVDVQEKLSGEFDGLREGAWVTSYQGIDLFVSYKAGDGNDVGLKAVTAVPEPNTFFLIAILSLMTKIRRTWSFRNTILATAH